MNMIKASHTGIAPHRAATRPRSGFTLTEAIVAFGIGFVVLAGLFPLLLVVATEQRRTYADMSVEDAVGRLQDRISIVLRSMSASESVILSDPVNDEQGHPIGFARAIVARGKSPDFPREELILNVSQGTVTHDPNRSVNSDEIQLFRNNSESVLRQAWLSPTVKTDGSPDWSLIRVWLMVDDNRTSGRRSVAGNLVTTVATRSFAVKMRNP